MKRSCIIVILILFLIILFSSGCTTAPSKLHGTWSSTDGSTLKFYRDWITERCMITDSTGSVDVEVKINDERIAFMMDGETLSSTPYRVTKNKLCFGTLCYERITQPSFTDDWIMQLEEWLT